MNSTMEGGKRNGFVTLAYKELKQLPGDLLSKNTDSVLELDLSHNKWVFDESDVWKAVFKATGQTHTHTNTRTHLQHLFAALLHTHTHHLHTTF